MSIKNFDIKIKYESIYNMIFLLFLITLFTLSSYRIIFEVFYILCFGIYFITRKKRLTSFFIWNIFFITICALSLLWTKNTSQTLIETRIMIEWAIVCNLLIGYLDTEEKFITMYKFFVISGGSLVLKLLVTFPIETWLTGRLGSNDLGLNPNRIGIYMTIAGMCAFYLAMYDKKKAYYFAFLIFSIVSMLTGSRKALILLILGVLGVIYFNSKGVSKKIKFLIVMTVLIGIIYGLIMYIPTLYNIVGNRIESLLSSLLGNSNGDYSSNMRKKMVDTGIILFKDKPFLGYGIGSYASLTSFGVYSHNNYIELLVGVGIIGLIIYYSIYFFIIINLFKFRHIHFITPMLTLMLILPLLEYGLVSYNGPVYQIILAVSFAQSRLLKKMGAIN